MGWPGRIGLWRWAGHRLGWAGLDNPRGLLGDRLREGSLYRLLADHGHQIFPDGYFADLYADSAKGRPTVAARVVATVMLLQAFEGLSDREAADRLEVDLRWQAAAGVDAGYRGFHPTVLAGMRNKLRASARPRRLFEDTKATARATGAMKHRARVLDSTAVYDAVATQDTVTQLRSAIRKVLSALDKARSPVAAAVRRVLRRDDDYAGPGKPPCDWDDPAAREVLVDELVKDALLALGALDGQQLPLPAAGAADLLALVAGQDVEQGGDGVFRIARKTAKDRVISTVDTAARHGHKSRNRHFDGYKAHLSVDPDSELIDEVAATAANTPDRDAAGELLDELAGATDKPDVAGDSAYGDAATRADLEAQGVHGRGEVPAGPQCRRPVPQGPLRRRSGTRHRDLPGRAGHRHRPGWPGRRQGIVPALVRRLPAAICVHQRPPGPHDRHPPARGRPAESPRHPA